MFTIAWARRNIILALFLMIYLSVSATAYSQSHNEIPAGMLLLQEEDLLDQVKTLKGEEKFQAYAKLANLFRDNEKTLHYIDLMESTAREMKSPSNIGDAMLMRARYYYNNYYAEEFLEYASVVKQYLAMHDNDRYIDMEIMIIRMLLKEGLNETALQTAQKLLELAETKNSRYWEAYAYFGIGIVYAAGKHYDKAIDAFERCYEITDNPKLKLDVCLDLISNTHNNKDYDNSLRYCGLASELLNDYIYGGSAGDDRESALRYIRMYINCCYVMNLTQLENTEDAYGYLLKAEQDIDPYAGLDNQFYNQAAATYYGAIGDNEKALHYANLMVGAFSDEDMILNYIEALGIKTNILAGMGEYGEAYRNMEYIKRKQDSLNSSQLAVQLSEFYTLYELGKLEKEKQRQRNLIILIGAVCLFLAVIVCIYFLYSRSLSRKNLALYRQIQENMHNEKEHLRVIRLATDADLSREKKLFLEICELMKDENVFTDTAFGRQTMVKLLNTNDKYLADAIHDGAGSTVAGFISDYRLSYSLRLLTSTPDISMEEVALKSGHGSYSSFLRAFSKKYGMSPSDYRKLSMKKKHKDH